MRHGSIDRWRARLEKAALLVASRLDDPPTLEELAAAAAVSPFHFHRIWRALTGETVNHSVLRLRLEVSKALLRGPAATVAETATAVGFATPQSFARAFRRHTGLTPTEHRAAGVPVPAAALTDLKVAVEQRGEVLVVALRRTSKPYVNLNATFAQVWSWAENSGALQRLDGIYGIPLDDPENVAEDHLRYDACLALGTQHAPEPFHMVALPAGCYARFRHLGSYDGLEAATQSLGGYWLAASGREPAEFPAFYQFLNDPDTTPAQELATDILLPLASNVESPL